MAGRRSPREINRCSTRAVAVDGVCIASVVRNGVYRVRDVVERGRIRFGSLRRTALSLGLATHGLGRFSPREHQPSISTKIGN
jgi:hypothetical protein